MTKLSVNVNKLATLRNSRGKNRPDVTALSQKILRYGAHGLTVHPRPDGRHIRVADVVELKSLVESWNQGLARTTQPVEFNIEGFPSTDFMQLIRANRPDQCTLVPDPPEALTSSAGWALAEREAVLAQALSELRDLGVRSSVFVDPRDLNLDNRAALGRLRPDRIELYTERYADQFHESASSIQREAVTKEYLQAAEVARDFGIGVNAGHDLDQQNLGFLLNAIPWIEEVSIGHALICEALEQGLQSTLSAYLKIVTAP